MDMMNKQELYYRIDEADKVIIVLSPGVSKKVIDLNNGIYDRSIHDTYNTDMFPIAFQHITRTNQQLKSKVLFVAFQYAPLERHPFGNKTYHLMEDIDMFLALLHGVLELPNHLMDATDQTSLTNEHMRKLILAVKDMDAYVLSAANWFEKHHRFGVENTDTESQTDQPNNYDTATILTGTTALNDEITDINNTYDDQTRGREPTYVADPTLIDIPEMTILPQDIPPNRNSFAGELDLALHKVTGTKIMNDNNSAFSDTIEGMNNTFDEIHMQANDEPEYMTVFKQL